MEDVHCASCEVTPTHDDKQYHVLFYKTIIAGVIGAALMIVNMCGLVPGLNTDSGYAANCVFALIILAVLVYCGKHYFIGAYKAFLIHRANMDTLIAISTGMAWLYSVFVLVFFSAIPSNAQNVYFETSAIIIALVNLGTLIEMRSTRNTTQALQLLINMQPKTARVIRLSKEMDITIEQLLVDDSIRVHPGEQIPADGVITQGTGLLDESMLTGEATPKNVQVGYNVAGGTMNTNGSFIFKVTRTGKDTVLAHIVAVMQQALASKPKLARQADHIAAIFVPAVLIMAIITGLVWYNSGVQPSAVYMLVTSVSVLVIACPCALGLAVPISTLIGIGKAAEYGILIHNADVLQKITKLTTVVLDKTGTVTIGHPRLINIFPMSHFNTRDILTIAASLELGSEHPFATAIMNAANNEQLHGTHVDNFQAIAGLGVLGDLEGVPVAVGNASFMAAQLITVDELHNEAKTTAEYGETLIYVAQNKRLVGALSIADPIRQEAKQAVAKLQAMKIKVVMVSGDHQASTAAIAKRAGISEFYSQVMPEEKADKIVALQQQGEKVAMVGDGINDLPALATGDVSFAMGTGTDIALQTADVTLMHGSLYSIVDAIYIARKTVKNMHKNLLLAFLYNMIAIPIAAGVLYPVIGLLLSPIVAGVAMALSSISVVINANSLRKIKLTSTESTP